MRTIIAVLASMMSAAPDDVATDDLAGYWWTFEESKDGKPSRVGMVHVAASKREDGTVGYVVSWMYGRELTQGAGERKGELLAIGWSGGPGKIGVTLYEVKGTGKSLSVRSSTERWVRAKPPGDV